MVRKHIPLTSTKEEENFSETGTNLDMDAHCLTSGVSHIRRRRTRNIIDDIDCLGKKQNMGINTVEGIEPVDKISELPECIIHHILSFLRSEKEAARTSILSKRWRDAWKSFSVLTFDERHLRGEVNFKDNQMFIDFVDKSLQCHLERNSCIYKLVLRVTSPLSMYLNHWVKVAVKGGVKELELHVVDIKSRFHFLPHLLCSAESLTGLRIHCCNWVNFADIKFRNLQRLYLRRLYIEEQMIQTLISTCPSIMDLRIVDCEGLKTLNIPSSAKLDRIELHHCLGLRKIKLQVANLQTFWYSAKKSAPCKINLESCKFLKRLTLEDPNMTDTLLVQQLSNFPILEKLDLSRCSKLSCIRIPNLQLRSLILRSCKNVTVAHIDTSRLCLLDYKGHVMAWNLSDQSCLNEAKFSFVPTQKDVEEIERRNSIIHSFLQKHCRGSNIVVCSSKHVIIHEDSQEIYLPLFPDLKLHVINSSRDCKDLLDGLLRTCLPEKLFIISSPSSNFHEMVDDINTEEDPSCCRYNASSNKCWRHFLQDTKIVNPADAEDILWDWRRWNSLNSAHQITSIELFWKQMDRSRNCVSEMK